MIQADSGRVVGMTGIRRNDHKKSYAVASYLEEERSVSRGISQSGKKQTRVTQVLQLRRALSDQLSLTDKVMVTDR